MFAKAYERKLENNHENSLYFPSSSFKKFKKQSFDYAILEKDKDIFLIPASFGWSDVGSWEVTDNSKKDRQAIPFSSNKSKKVFTQSTKDTHLEIIENSKKVYALFGVNDLVIADSPDALLISACKDKSSEIKKSLQIRSSQPLRIQQRSFSDHGVASLLS